MPRQECRSPHETKEWLRGSYNGDPGGLSASTLAIGESHIYVQDDEGNWSRYLHTDLRAYYRIPGWERTWQEGDFVSCVIEFEPAPGMYPLYHMPYREPFDWDSAVDFAFFDVASMQRCFKDLEWVSGYSAVVPPDSKFREYM